MKFLADQNFPRTSTLLLAEFGHELVLTSFDPEASLSDHWIFEEAQRRGAVLLTTDKDFFHTIPWLYLEHKGAVILRSSGQTELPSWTNCALVWSSSKPTR